MVSFYFDYFLDIFSTKLYRENMCITKLKLLINHNKNKIIIFSKYIKKNQYFYICINLLLFL